MKIDSADPFPLVPGRVVEFDGSIPVESWGRCVDFNLMVRKGRGQGAASVLSGPCDEIWTPDPGDLAVYCVFGAVRLPDFRAQAQAGQTLLCRGVEGNPARLVCEAGLVMLASIREM